MNLAHCNKSWLNVKYKQSHVVGELKNPHFHPPYLKNPFGKNYVGTLVGVGCWVIRAVGSEWG